MQSNSILIVEDEQVVRNIMAEVITYLGYDVTVAADGTTAIDNLCKKNYVLVISDLGLPDFDGIELIHRMRKMGLGIPVLIIGGVDENTGVDKCRGLAGCHYVSKPFDIKEIGMMIEKLINPKSAESGQKANFNI